MTFRFQPLCRVASWLPRLALSFFLTGQAAGLLAQETEAAVDDKPVPLAVPFLVEGKINDGIQQLKSHLKAHPEDEQARVGLGVTQFIRGVEHLAQSLYQYGTLQGQARWARQFPVIRLDVPQNSTPDQIRYADLRRIFQNLIDDLAEAEKTLAAVQDKSVKLPIPFLLVKLDVNGNGKAEENEKLFKLFAQVARTGDPSNGMMPKEFEQMIVGFDYSDVLWLRGYCNLLSAFSETVLMYDQQKFFNAIAHNIFAKPDVSMPLVDMQTEQPYVDEFADFILAIHLANFPVKEAERGAKALDHMQKVIDLSRLTWEAIEAETDNDREWIPSPAQTCVIPGLRVTSEMVGTWKIFLREAELILQGKKLIPHWRLPAGGINVRKIFLEPREFDLVLYVHGAGLLPYFEKGEVTDSSNWSQFQRVFQGQFIGFAAWFN